MRKGRKGVIYTNGKSMKVNIRRAPGYSTILKRHHPVITSIKSEKCIEILDVAKAWEPVYPGFGCNDPDNIDYTMIDWYYVRYKRFILPDVYGWVNGKYISW